MTELREEIVKTEKHEWREALHLEKKLLEGVIEQLSCDAPSLDETGAANGG